MKRTTLVLAGTSLTQLLVAAAIGMPITVQAQARPNVEETLAPIPGRKNYAQDLIDRAVKRWPELVEIDIHATPPGSAQSAIVASKNAQRVGKATDADDLEVFKTGVPRVEINKQGNNNVEVAVQLQDVTGSPVGTLELTFPYVTGTDQEALIAKANQIGDALRRRIAHGAEDLVTPAQYDLKVPVETYAQYLVDDALARQPGVLVLVLHLRAPGAEGYPIVASNIGRIGKEADASDLAVIGSGTAARAVSADGKRLEVKLPIADASGATLGAVAIVFPRRIADEASLTAQAEKIRDDLARRIPAMTALYGPYPSTQAKAPIQTAYDKPELGNTQSLPMTKAVTSGAALEQASQEGYSEAIKGVAGVSPANSKGTANDSVNIRGIKLNLFANYRLNGGLPIVGLITVPTEDKERIETLKGANALMFGVASPAGILNMVTKRAGDVDVTSLGIAGNSFGQYGGTVDVGRRFGAERSVGLRVNASAAHLENGIHGTAGFGRFASLGFDYKVNDRLSIQADYEYYMKDVGEQAGVSLLAVNPATGKIPVTAVPNPRNRLSGPWNVYLPDTTNQQVRADFIMTEDWKLLLESGRSDGNRSRYTVRIGGYDLQTGANGLVTVNFADQTYRNLFSRGEVLGRFTTWGLRHDLTLGSSISERDALGNAQNATTLAQRQNIYDPIELPPPVFTKPNTTLPLQASADTGAYGYDTISVGSKWKVLLGLRRTRDDESSGTRRSITNVNSPAYGALWDIIPSLTLFASYMEGLEAGGTAPATAINVNEILPSAISKQKEIGIRDSHIKGISLNASYFEITRANAVTDPVTKIYANSGNIDYKGLEATFTWDFLRRWTFSAAGQVLKAKQDTPDPTFNGFWPENTPKALGNLSIAYRPEWVPGLRLTAGVQGISYRFMNNQEQGTIPGYALGSLGAAYTTRIYGKRTAFQVNVDNIGNLRYWNSVQTGTYGIGMDRSTKFNVRVDL